MSEKRFTVDDDGIYDNHEKRHFKFIAYDWIDCDIYECCEKLNEQQATIQRMKHSLNTIYKAFEKHYGYDMRNAIWLIDELSYDDNEIGFDSDE